MSDFTQALLILGILGAAIAGVAALFALVLWLEHREVLRIERFIEKRPFD